jgi:hypothetical protein
MKPKLIHSHLVLSGFFALATSSTHASIIIFNGISGDNNDGIPASFGSNLSSDIGGANVSNGATPDIALAWGGGTTNTGDVLANGWDIHGRSVDFWEALDSTGPTSTTPTIGQMEYPTDASPMTVTFTVDTAWALQLNSVDIGMANDKIDTYYFDVTISEVGGSEVFSTLTAAMDGDGGTGLQALTVDFDFTGTLGTDYVLAFREADSFGNIITGTNGGAIDNLSFSQAVPEPSTSALLGLGGLALILRRRK